ISNTLQHSCSKCTHKYKATADVITSDDNAAVVGIDENRHLLMDPTHCAFENCSEPLKNACTGVFCITHESQHKNLCCMKDCCNQKEEKSQTCVNHRQRWYNHVIRFGRQSVLGI
ncbi:hypothetical protein BDQ17DRAFT_1255213, partial [Cyathus striatus]